MRCYRPSHSVPLVDLRAQRSSISTEIEAAIARAVGRCDYILGEDVELFEREFAGYCDVPHAVGVGSGTDALNLACRALDLGEGDEVIVPAMTFASTAFAVSLTGALPVLVDVRPEDGLIDPELIEAALTPRTKAIIAVHLYGRCADMEAISAVAARRSLAVVEDAAQAHGAAYRGKRAGALADIACFSFYPSKNLGAFGDGGAVTTRRSDIADAIRVLRNCGSRVKYQHERIGLNSRLDTLQAAILRVKLGHLEAWNRQRRAWAARYDELLADLPGVELTRPDPFGAYHLYVVRVAGRDAVAERLRAQRVGVGVHYPLAIHELEAYRFLRHGRGDFPVAEDWARRCLSLPLYPELSTAGVETCVSALRAAVLDGGRQ